MKTYPCFRIKQWGYGKGAESVYIYVTSMPLKDLWSVDIDRWSKENREGYQRAPSEARFGAGRGSIVRYLLNELGAFPTSVLISARGDLKFEAKNKVHDNIEFGELSIADNIKLVIIDGQHRIEALKRAWSSKPELENYPLPVSIMNFKDKFDEMVHFYIVNSRQRSIPTDLVYRQLQIFMEKALLGDKEWIKDVILGPQQERQALAAYIVDFLNEMDNSPFKNRIQYVGEERNEERHLVKDFVLARFITKIMKEKAFLGISSEKLAELLADYWSAIRDLYRNCFEKPDGYTLLKTTGIASFTYLFPTIFAYCAADGDISLSRFKYYLSMLREKTPASELAPDFQRPIDESWWSTAHGPSIARATSEALFNDIVKNMAKKIEIIRNSKVLESS
jgi:DGQHR domain-containing protein